MISLAVFQDNELSYELCELHLQEVDRFLLNVCLLITTDCNYRHLDAADYLLLTCLQPTSITIIHAPFAMDGEKNDISISAAKPLASLQWKQSNPS